MTRQYSYKTNFTAGELDPRLLGRGDLKAYENGAGRLSNVVLHPTGGVSRRDGLEFLAEMPGAGRLVGFEFNTEQIYLLVFTHFRLDVYQDGALIAGNISAPWHESHLSEIAWVQSADTLFVAHPSVRPRMITRNGPGDWRIDLLEFSIIGKEKMVPHHKFLGLEATLTPSAATGDITLTASEPLFVDTTHQGVPFRLHGGQARITNVVSATVADATVEIDLNAAEETANWTEEAFSPVRGWPSTVAFHQNRLVFGGSRDLPNHIWMSKTDDLFNFDAGDGLDDEAIHFELLSDQVNAVRGMLSGRRLQVFTSGGEWMVTGDPLTPKTVQVKRQTRIGSRLDRFVPPRNVDGATLFVSRDGGKLSEYTFADVDRAFLANDLSLLAGHIVEDMIDLEYEDKARLVHAVLGDGRLATLTQFRTEKVTAWSHHETDGAVTSVAVVGDFVYLLVERDGGTFLEVFEPSVGFDAALRGSADPPADTWSGLDHLEGETVGILADGRIKPRQTVADGRVVLDEPASEVVVGLPFTHEVAPLPALARNALGLDHAIKIRLIRATFRLFETADLRVDVGEGPRPVPFGQFGDALLGAPSETYSGDKSVRALGWQSAKPEPLWRIVSDAPLPFTLLSVTTEIKVND
ncbi:hypothetical protein [Ferruginivarius sediminum]|uniref:Uncharacterized protein n=1 Tax=Ferruginivarius sediminum TaxID=2661937 RepID=A0A369T6X4_9PROT|nr:hypothetical protein [Ferruginivarius sediminum]RDD61070.1 hypothetical protein DRB17_15215 [Ferruginivarius sediminum]